MGVVVPMGKAQLNNVLYKMTNVLTFLFIVQYENALAFNVNFVQINNNPCPIYYNDGVILYREG